MSITYNEQERVFRLDTPHTTYLIGIVDEEGFLGHIYYGQRIPDENMQYLMRIYESPRVPSVNPGDRISFFDSLPTEYPGHGLGDFRASCLTVENAQGSRACGLVYDSHRIFAGKPKLEGLPATYGTEGECDTLEIICREPVLGLTVKLLYTAFSDVDAITRSVQVVNTAQEPVQLKRVLSACLDLDDNMNFEVVTLHGNWALERMICRKKLGWGKESVSSHRGITSPQEQPFMALVEKGTNQRFGQVYAMNLVYSGNFLAQAEANQQGPVRMVMGLSPEDFSWRLQPGEGFQAPEVVLVYSNTGLGGMTRTFHDLYREHLVRGPYKHKRRPTLVNNWEATYFGFNTQKLLEIAKDAAEADIEMFVLDDGWFGHRDNDRSSLGDWFVNEEKLPGGLTYLVEQINAMGLKFGLWVEPEMVSPDSELYRAHPDYALKIPGRTPTLGRHQLVLDITRKEVRDAVYSQLKAVLSSANIEYVKWDMNRPLTDVYSLALGPEGQGELYHRFVLGMYELQDRMLRDFPHLLLENCCSGGGRFDPGMLYYSPQIWTSDNTDAIDRLRIQEGTAMVYPLSTMGAHVAACPSHTNGRVTPFQTRADVALPGCFGYELDLTQLTPEEKAMIPGQLENHRKYSDVFRTGDYYRLASYSENGEVDAIMAVTKDKRLAVIDYVQVMSRYRGKSIKQPLEGLREDLYYRNVETGEVHSGAGWMHGGILLPKLRGDFQSKLIVLEAVEV